MEVNVSFLRRKLVMNKCRKIKRFCRSQGLLSPNSPQHRSNNSTPQEMIAMEITTSTKTMDSSKETGGGGNENQSPIITTLASQTSGKRESQKSRSSVGSLKDLDKIFDGCLLEVYSLLTSVHSRYKRKKLEKIGESSFCKDFWYFW